MWRRRTAMEHYAGIKPNTAIRALFERDELMI
jgi:hypothetical protein